MTYRAQQALILVFWMCSMTWLFVTKIMPVVTSHHLPDSQLIGPGTDRSSDHVMWRIELDGESIGTATTTVHRPAEGTPMIESVVSLQRFPVAKMLSRLLGSWSILTRSVGVENDEMVPSLQVRTRMQFSPYGEMQMFVTEVDVASFVDLLKIRGTLIERNRLQVIVSTNADYPDMELGGISSDGELYRQILKIPPDTLILDGLTPHPKLSNLRVGQEWTMRSVRPLSPSHAVRLTHACVLRKEIVPWAREMESMFVVVLEDETPGELTSAKESSAWLWVRDDGTVVRQKLRISGMTFDFRRIPESSTTTSGRPR